MTREEFETMCADLSEEELGWVHRLLIILHQDNKAAIKVIDGFLDQLKTAPRGTIPHARFGEILDEAEEAAGREKGEKAS